MRSLLIFCFIIILILFTYNIIIVLNEDKKYLHKCKKIYILKNENKDDKYYNYN